MSAKNCYRSVDGYSRTLKGENMIRREKGSLTVEALLFLIPFMCAFLTLINAARFVQTEMLIHHAITQTAKQMSACSYVLTKTKITERMQGTHKKSEKFIGDVNDVTGSFTELAGVLGSGDLDGLDDAINHAKTAYATAESYISNPKELVAGALSVVKSEGETYITRNIAGAITRGNIREAISEISDDPDKYLKNVGIVDGIAGLDFSNTEWLGNDEGKGNLNIVVTYTMKNVLFPDFDFGQHEFCQSVSTLTW